MLALRVRENLGAMEMKGYTTFLIDQALQEPHHQIVYLECWVRKMVIPVYRVSEGEVHSDEPRSLGAKIPNQVRQIPPDVPSGGDVKSSQKDSTKIPDIFSALVSPLNSTLYTGKTVYCYCFTC